jgi:hypothetical protein
MVTAYPMPGKPKSVQICRAFIEGCSGIVEHNAREVRPGVAFFYGVGAGNEHLWRQVLAEKRQFIYADNSYFDATRQNYFRLTRNAVQHSGEGVSNGERWRKLDLRIRQWRSAGDHLVLCPQSESFMRTVAGVMTDWTTETRQALARLTPRPLRVRGWSPDKAALAATLEQDLSNAHALVTYSSAAAITAILYGVPAICTGPCAASPMAGTLRHVEWPPMPSYEARTHWASVLADQQFTLSEMSSGYAWRALEAQ